MGLSDYLDSYDFKKFKQQLDKLTAQTSLLHAMGSTSAVAEKLVADMAGAKKDHSTMFFPVGSLSQINPTGDTLGEGPEGDGPHNTTYTFHRFYKGKHLRVTSTVSTYKTPTGYWTDVVGGPLDGEHSVAVSKIGALTGHKEMCTAVRQIGTG